MLVKWLTLLTIALLPIVASRKAIVTLLAGESNSAERYTRLLHFFVFSLRNTGYQGEIAVLYATDFPVKVANLALLLNIVLIPVKKISVPKLRRNSQYSSMLTKLHLWNLTEYEQIMYYDCDFVFQRNPVSAFDKCAQSSLCATSDTGMSEVVKSVVDGSYFNGGFMVIRPNEDVYKFLLSKKHEANNKRFVEQDLLNILYKNKWRELDKSYNLMHAYKLNSIPANIIAVHEKMWILRQRFVSPHYIWNSPKLTINYEISTLMNSTAMISAGFIRPLKLTAKKSASVVGSRQLILNGQVVDSTHHFTKRA